MKTVSPAGTRWPWLTRRRGLTVLGIVLVAGIAIPWQHRANQQRFLDQFDVALPQSVALSADALGDWVALHALQARTLATLAQQGGRTPGAAARTLGLMLPVIAQQSGYREARIDRVTGPGARVISPEALPPRDSSDMAYAEFSAPVGDTTTAHERVVLRATLSEATLSRFNIAAADDRTQRTMLLLRPTTASPDARADRRGVGAALRLLVASHAGGSDTLARQSVATGVQPQRIAGTSYATEAAVRAHSHGRGTGIGGQPVIYATAAVPGTPWLLVRERDTAELTERIDTALLVSDAVFTVVSLLLVGVLLLWWRAQHQRMEMAAVRNRTAFVAGVSHELRTPLTQVRMYAEMLRLGMLATPEDRERALSVIEKEAERLGQLIERALTFVRTGQPAPVAAEAPASLTEAVRRAHDAIAPLASERGVRLVHDIDPSLSVRIARDDLHQVLLNLLDNAIKYGPRDAEVVVTGTRDHGVVTLAVRDHGPGVAPAERDAIWEPYRRGQAAAQNDAVGTGIGLVIVRSLVERAGGRVAVRGVGDAPATRDMTRATGAVFVVEVPSGN